MSGISESVLLKRVYRKLSVENDDDCFNDMYGRSDLTSTWALLDRLGYTDALLLATVLEPGQAAEPWTVANKYDGLRRSDVSLRGEAGTSRVNFAHSELVEHESAFRP